MREREIEREREREREHETKIGPHHKVDSREEQEDDWEGKLS